MPHPLMSPPALACVVACAGCVAWLLLADRRGWAAGRALFKTGAAAAFVALAVVLDAPATAHGRTVLLALALGALGDVLLLSRREPAFLAGLGAFLLSHAAYALAFWRAGVDPAAAAMAGVPAAAVGVAVWRWLSPHLQGPMRPAVALYVAVILVMCAAATGRVAAGGPGLALAGALLFALSDLSVARDRFIAPGFVNRLWGWPTYFGAQLLLAATVAAGPA